MRWAGLTPLDIEGGIFTAWRPVIPLIGPAGDHEDPNPPEGATWVVGTGVGAGAGLIGRDVFLARPSALFLYLSRTFWLTLWPSRRWS